MKPKNIFLSALAGTLSIVSLQSCVSLQPLPEDYVSPRVKTSVLLQGGCGTMGNDSTVGIATLPCCIAGFQQADGISIEMLKTADYHLYSINHTGYLSSTEKRRMLPELETLIAQGKLKATTLAQILSYHRRHGLKNPLVIQLRGEHFTDGILSCPKKTFAKIAGELQSKSVQYSTDTALFVVSDKAKLLSSIKDSLPKTTTILSYEKTLEKTAKIAVKYGINAVSVPYDAIAANPSFIDIIHANGLKILITGVEADKNMDKIKPHQPDFIQTNDFNFKSFTE